MRKATTVMDVYRPGLKMAAGIIRQVQEAIDAWPDEYLTRDNVSLMLDGIIDVLDGERERPTASQPQ